MAAGDEAGDARKKLGPELVSGASRQLEPKRPEDAPKVVGKEVVRSDDPEEKLPHLDRDEQRSLPPGMAELIVFPLDPEAGSASPFGLRGACCCTQEARNLHDPRFRPRRPKIDLSREIARGGTLPDIFVNRMTAWSDEQVTLTDWLDERRRKHDKLQLMVWDDTGFRVPWELLWLPRDSDSTEPVGDYLGAVVTVTRWLTLRPKQRNRDRVRTWLNHGPYQATGPVTAYIHEAMRGDEGLFDGLDPEFAADMPDLFKKLKEKTPPNALALVYVACHCQFGDDPEDCALDGFPYGVAVRYNDDLIRLRNQHTLVFLNGCNTGAVGVDVGTYNDGALRGFAKVFLRAGAAGVVATTGAVQTEQARVQAGRVFKYLREHPELGVADALRELRAEAAEKMTWDLLLTNRSPKKREEGNKELHTLLQPFMYVYFGSPRMLLSLTRRDEQAGAREPVGAD